MSAIERFSLAEREAAVQHALSRAARRHRCCCPAEDAAGLAVPQPSADDVAAATEAIERAFVACFGSPADAAAVEAALLAQQAEDMGELGL